MNSNSIFSLAIETTGTICSVAIFKNDICFNLKESKIEYSHAELLAIYTDEILKDAKLTLKQLSFISVSHGPGSYTGLRIGSAFSKGLAYCLDIPIIAVSTLKSMALAMQENIKETNYIPLIDARRKEVYMQVFDKNLNELSIAKAHILDNDSFKEYSGGLCIGGDASGKCKDEINNSKEIIFIEEDLRSSRHIGKLAYDKFCNSEFEDTAYFEPFYLKKFSGK
jgi:tRNA threonylcarbamoyladenosine biosynthesis protein TsaB